MQRTGWVIVHPNNRIEMDYWDFTRFEQQRDQGGYVPCTQEEWRKQFRPDCKMFQLTFTIPTYSLLEQSLTPKSERQSMTLKNFFLFKKCDTKQSGPGAMYESLIETFSEKEVFNIVQKYVKSGGSTDDLILIGGSLESIMVGEVQFSIFRDSHWQAWEKPKD